MTVSPARAGIDPLAARSQEPPRRFPRPCGDRPRWRSVSSDQYLVPPPGGDRPGYPWQYVCVEVVPPPVRG